MTTPPTYRIEHISDLLLVPPDKLDACLADLAMALAAARLLLASGQFAGARPRRTVLGHVLWIDDGQRFASCDLSDGNQLVIEKAT